MGIETILFASLTGLSAISKMSQARDEAKSITRNAEMANEADRVEGELAIGEKAKEIRQKAAAQKSSFLSAGLLLDGTPEVVIGETFSTGLEDIENIRKGYNTRMTSRTSVANAQSKTTISSARTQAIEGIAKNFASFGGGSLFDTTNYQTGGTIGAPLLNKNYQFVGTYKV